MAVDTSLPMPSRGLGSVSARDGRHDLLRLTVTARGVRRDLVLPGLVPVVELLPEVVGLLGVAGADDWGGWTLVRLDARPLDPGAGLRSQGVVDGGVLTLVPTAELDEVAGGRRPGAVLYDDVAEAVADVVGGSGPPWGGALTAATTRAATAVLSLLVLMALVLQVGRAPSDRSAPVAAAGAAVGLLVIGAVLGRVRRDPGTAVAVLVAAAPYAAVAGIAWGSGDRLGWSLVRAGVAVVGVGLASVLALRRSHWAFHGSVLVGLVGVALGATHVLTGVDTATVAAVLVVAVVVGARFVPWLGLTITGSVLTAGGPTDGPVASAEVRRHVVRVHDLVLGVTAGAAVVVTVSAPLLVQLGAPGLGIVGACGVLAVLRTRQHVLRLDVLVGVTAGGATVVAGTVSALVLHPDWAPWLTAVAGAALLVALAALVAPPRASARGEQVLDLVEGLALGSLLPLLVVGVGLVAAVRGAGG